MKNLLSVLLSSLVFISCASMQPISQQSGVKEYIINESYTKDKAYDYIMVWAAKTYNSANDVIQLKDKDNGIIIIQAKSSYYYDALQTLLINYRYTLEIKIKDEKLKLVFTTGQTDNSGQLPQQGDLPKILAKYEFLKNNLIDYLKTANDNF